MKAEEVSSIETTKSEKQETNVGGNEQSDFRAGIRPWTDRICFFFTMIPVSNAKCEFKNALGILFSH
jgi:hypothetical protein